MTKDNELRHEAPVNQPANQGWFERNAGTIFGFGVFAVLAILTVLFRIANT